MYTRFILVILMLLTAQANLLAQSKLNFGLLQPQPVSTLPTTKVAAPSLVPNWSGDTIVSVSLTPNQKQELQNGWRLISDSSWLSMQLKSVSDLSAQPKWIKAVVPGTVLQSLVQSNHYPDPYFHLNNMLIPESLHKSPWWYRLQFRTQSVPKESLVWLQSAGINYQGTFWLNGHCLGTVKGAFKRGLFNVTPYLKTQGINELMICVTPPPNPGIPHEQSKLSGMGPNGGQMCMDGPTFLSAEGWDWVPGIRDRNIGLWQSISLHTSGTVLCQDPQIITDLPLPDTSSAQLSIRVPLHNYSAAAQWVSVQVQIKDVSVQKSIELEPGKESTLWFRPDEFPALQIRNPQLWWPNGMGNPNLYEAQVQVVQGNQILDRDSIRFGIREFSYELMAKTPTDSAWRFLFDPLQAKRDQTYFDHNKRVKRSDQIAIPFVDASAQTPGFSSLPKENDNPYMVLRVNGVRVFCKGGNWGMDDGLKQVSRAHLEPAFALHRDLHFNMIRNWTGESTEPVFFELADEYGMLVWNDFWMSTEGYNLPPNDQKLWLDNSLDVIKRYRNHPSIAIWCPRNEGYAPDGIEQALAKQIQQEDGTRHYIGNSRELNLRQSGPWHFFENPALYAQKQADGFTTEIGTFAIPTASTIRKFIAPSEQWPISDAWYYHDLHSNNQNLEGYLAKIDRMYGPSTSLDEFCKKAQMINYESHRAIFEAWNSKRWNHASGVLLWMSHPAWPSMIWQTYTYDFETPGGYFGAKKACEPLHIQWQSESGFVEAINATRIPCNATASIEHFTMQGKKIGGRQWKISLPENLRVQVGLFQLDQTKNEPALVRLSLSDQTGRLLSINEYWLADPTTKNMTTLPSFAQNPLQARLVTRSEGRQEWKITNTGKSIAAGLKCYVLDENKKNILPAYWSDGYFNLLPGESKTIDIQTDKNKSPSYLEVEGLNIPLQIISKK